MESLINFLQQWWQFIALVGGVILAIVVTAGLIGRHSRRNPPARPVKPAPIVEPIVEPVAEPVAEVPPEPVPTPAPSDPNPVPTRPADDLPPAPAAPAPSVPVTPAPVETHLEANPADPDADAPAAVAPAPSQIVEPTPVPAPASIPEPKPEPKPKEPKPELGAYHVLYRPEDGKWIVKRDGSPKIMRTLETQTDAVNWTTIKALTQDVEMIVHKKDGSVKPVPSKSSK